MRDYIEERAINIAHYIVDNSTTVRQTARQFGVSKSTVHKDVTQRLSQINPGLASQTRAILDINKSERHIRGGLATREKYRRRAALPELCAAQVGMCSAKADTRNGHAGVRIS